MIIGHRAVGVSETRIEDFQQAVDLGLEMIEFDLRMTADQQLVVFHGPPGMEGQNILGDKSAAQADRQAGYRLPRLSEIIEICAGKIRFDLEIKESGILPAVIEQFSGAAKINAGGHIITSFLDPVILAAKEGGLTAGLILGRFNIGARQRLGEFLPQWRRQNCQADFLLPERRIYQYSPLRQAFSGAIIWGINSQDDWERAFADQRITGIITDFPQQAQELYHSIYRD